MGNAGFIASTVQMRTKGGVLNHEDTGSVESRLWIFTQEGSNLNPKTLYPKPSNSKLPKKSKQQLKLRKYSDATIRRLLGVKRILRRLKVYLTIRVTSDRSRTAPTSSSEIW